MIEKITILCLHKITDEVFPSWSGMSLNTFEKLLSYIKRHYDVILPEHLKINRSKKPRLILTFDDGFEDFYLNAFPLLKKYDIPAVLNAVALSITENHKIWTQQLNDIIDSYAKIEQPISIKVDGFKYLSQVNEQNAETISHTIFMQLLNKKKEVRDEVIKQLSESLSGNPVITKMMTSAQLKDVSNWKIAIGSHSMTHSNLKNENLKNEDLEYEIKESKKILENIIDKPIDIFAFPNGMYSDAGIEIAKKAGYKNIFLVNNNKAKVFGNEKTLLLDRILIYSNNHFKNIFRIKNLHNYMKW